MPATTYKKKLSKTPECQKGTVQRGITKLLEVARATGDAVNKTFSCFYKT